MEDKKVKHKLKTEIGLNSKFKFIRDLNGLCQGHNHLLISGTGKGKTTLIRSIAHDLSRDNKILYFSTEETIEDWEYYVATSEDDYSKVEFLREKDLFKLMDLKNDSITSFQKLVDQLAIIIGNNSIDVLFLDNLTTSLFYDSKNPSQQNEIFRYLKNMIELLKIPMITVAHASAGSQTSGTKLLNSQDIRNSKQVSNQAEVLWCFHNEILNLSGDDVFFPFIYAEKDRVGNSSQSIYVLDFDDNLRKYVSDKKTSWKTLTDNLANRAKLTRNNKSEEKQKPKLKQKENYYEVDFS